MQQKEINILCEYPRYTTISYLYRQNQKDKYKNQLQNQCIYKAKYSNCSWKQPVEKITSISSQKSSLSFNSILCSYNVILKHCRLSWGSRKKPLDITQLINLSTTEPSYYMSYYTINHHISHKHHTTSHYKPKRHWLLLKRPFWPKPWHYYDLPKFLDMFSCFPQVVLSRQEKTLAPVFQFSWVSYGIFSEYY